MVSCNDGLSRLDVRLPLQEPRFQFCMSILEFHFSLLGVVNSFSQACRVRLRHIKKPHHRWSHHMYSFLYTALQTEL